VSETNRAKEFQIGTAGVPESVKEGETGLPEGSDIGFETYVFFITFHIR